MDEDRKNRNRPPSREVPLDYSSPRREQPAPGTRVAGVVAGVGFSALCYLWAAQSFGMRAFPWVVFLVPLAKLITGTGLMKAPGVGPSLRRFGSGLLWSMLIILILLAIPVLLIIGICGGLGPIKLN